MRQRQRPQRSLSLRNSPHPVPDLMGGKCAPALMQREAFMPLYDDLENESVAAVVWTIGVAMFVAAAAMIVVVLAGTSPI